MKVMPLPPRAGTAGEQARLEHEVDRLTLENERITARFLEEEQRASDLMKLLISLRQLHEAAGRPQVLDALQDIVVNVIGSEEHALFAASDHDDILVAARTMGLGSARLSAIPSGDGAAAALTALRAAPRGLGDRAPMLSVPLMNGASMIGAIVIFGLLEHKAELDAFDRELLDLLTVHAGAALARTMPHASRGAVA